MKVKYQSVSIDNPPRTANPGNGSANWRTVLVGTMGSARQLLTPGMLLVGLALGVVSWGAEAAGLDRRGGHPPIGRLQIGGLVEEERRRRHVGAVGRLGGQPEAGSEAGADSH